jgi:hypothetical protein
MPDLRQAWTELIEAEDYERHMAAVGQAQANAKLLAELFRDHSPAPGASVHFAGAGTGQLFEYFPRETLSAYRVLCTDINPRFLERLKSRTLVETAVDDIEAPKPPGSYDLTIAVLVLEHVDWRRAVAGMCARSGRVFVVIQENPPAPAVRELPGTMAILRDASPHLIPRDELIETFRENGFELTRASSRDVADSKRMVGLDFTRRR